MGDTETTTQQQQQEEASSDSDTSSHHSDAALHCDFVESPRGTLKLLHANYVYSVNKRQRGGLIRWRCTNRRMACRGSITTLGSALAPRADAAQMRHCHRPDIGVAAAVRASGRLLTPGTDPSMWISQQHVRPVVDAPLPPPPRVKQRKKKVIMKTEQEAPNASEPECHSEDDAEEDAMVEGSNVSNAENFNPDVLLVQDRRRAETGEYNIARRSGIGRVILPDVVVLPASKSLKLSAVDPPVLTPIKAVQQTQQLQMLRKMQQDTHTYARRQQQQQQQPTKPTTAQPVEEVCLKWNSHHLNIQTAFPLLLAREQYVDVTLCSEGQALRCHKLVLSACSPYFDEMISNMSPWQHPVLFLNSIPFWVLKTLVDYMYVGEVSVDQNKLQCIIDAADELKIKGLWNMDAKPLQKLVLAPPKSASNTNTVRPPPAPRHPPGTSLLLSNQSATPATSGVRFTRMIQPPRKPIMIAPKLMKLPISRPMQRMIMKKEEADKMQFKSALDARITKITSQGVTVAFSNGAEDTPPPPPPPPAAAPAMESSKQSNVLMRKRPIKRRFTEEMGKPSEALDFVRRGTKSRPLVKTPNFYYNEFDDDGGVKQAKLSRESAPPQLEPPVQVKTEPLDITETNVACSDLYDSESERASTSPPHRRLIIDENHQQTEQQDEKISDEKKEDEETEEVVKKEEVDSGKKSSSTAGKRTPTKNTFSPSMPMTRRQSKINNVQESIESEPVAEESLAKTDATPTKPLT